MKVLQAWCFWFQIVEAHKKRSKDCGYCWDFPFFYFSFSIISLWPGFEPVTSLCTTLIPSNTKKKREKKTLACTKRKSTSTHTHTHTHTQTCTHTHTLVTSSASAQSAGLSWRRTLWAKSPGITGTGTNLPLTLSPRGFTAQASHCKHLLCFPACVKHTAFKGSLKEGRVCMCVCAWGAILKAPVRTPRHI